ncbi:MAG: hypothetical protein ACRC46_04615 [Thermoguttaceae bacterium]
MSFVVSDDGIEGLTDDDMKLDLKLIPPKVFKEKIDAIRKKDEARRAEIIDAVKPGTEYRVVWTARDDGTTGEMGLVFTSLSDEGYAITGALFELSDPKQRKSFTGQLHLGPDAPNAIIFTSVSNEGPRSDLCKTATAHRFLKYNDGGINCEISLTPSGLEGGTRYSHFKLTKK